MDPVDMFIVFCLFVLVYVFAILLPSACEMQHVYNHIISYLIFIPYVFLLTNKDTCYIQVWKRKIQ